MYILCCQCITQLANYTGSPLLQSQGSYGRREGDLEVSECACL